MVSVSSLPVFWGLTLPLTLPVNWRLVLVAEVMDEGDPLVAGLLPADDDEVESGGPASSVSLRFRLLLSSIEAKHCFLSVGLMDVVFVGEIVSVFLIDLPFVLLYWMLSVIYYECINPESDSLLCTEVVR